MQVQTCFLSSKKIQELFIAFRIKPNTLRWPMNGWLLPSNPIMPVVISRKLFQLHKCLGLDDYPTWPAHLWRSCLIWCLKTCTKISLTVKFTINAFLLVHELQVFLSTYILLFFQISSQSSHFRAGFQILPDSPSSTINTLYCSSCLICSGWFCDKFL